MILPSTAYAEKEGTFTNSQGRVQRLNAAILPAGEARPEWMILGALGARLGVDGVVVDAPTIFTALVQAEPAFAGLSYTAIGDQGALLAHGR